jgi:hypothetical protein
VSFDEITEGDEYTRDRSADVEAGALNPLTLLGSYFRAPSEDENEEFVEGLVVGQPFAGPATTIYLVEYYGAHGALGHQELVDIDLMLAQGWLFYDTADWLSMSARPEGKPVKKPTEFPKPPRGRKV